MILISIVDCESTVSEGFSTPGRVDKGLKNLSKKSWMLKSSQKISE